MADTSSDSSHNNGDCSQFDRLTLEQLALVLTHVPLQQRLTRAALVNTTWAKAARLSTTSISSYNCAGLSPWLQAHAACVGVSSIDVWYQAKARPFTGALLLPGPALQHSLKQLQLRKVSWEVIGSHAGLAALTSLTSLSLSGRGVRHLGGLSALSALQTLFVRGSRGDPEYFMPPGVRQMIRLSDLVPANVMLAYEDLNEDEQAEIIDDMLETGEGVPGFTRAQRSLAASLPHLQALTSLHLAEDIASTDVVAAASTLTALEQLVLLDAKVASFPAPLPRSLTRLNLDLSCQDGWPSLTRATSPGLSRLTGLRAFVLRNASPWDPQLLACSTALTRLVLVKAVFLPQGNQPTLQASAGASTAQQQDYGRLQPLSKLTALQHLELRECRFADAAAGAAVGWASAQGSLTPAEAEALTVPAHLTQLHLGGMSLQAEHYAAMFSAGRQLQHLLKLSVTTSLLALDTAGMQQVAACCPNLETLHLSRSVKPLRRERAPEGAAATTADAQASKEAAAAAQAELAAQRAALAAGLPHLTALGRLQALKVDMSDLKFLSAPVWRALGGVSSLSSLTSLDCDCPEPSYEQALQLSSLQGLQRLHVRWPSTPGTYPDSVFVTSKAPPGFPPDVWRQLPSGLYEAAEERMFDMISNEEYEDTFELTYTQTQIASAVVEHEKRQADELRAAQLQVRQLQAELEQARQQLALLQQQ